MRWKYDGESQDQYKCCLCCHVRTGTVFLGLFHLVWLDNKFMSENLTCLYTKYMYCTSCLLYLHGRYHINSCSASIMHEFLLFQFAHIIVLSMLAMVVLRPELVQHQPNGELVLDVDGNNQSMVHVHLGKMTDGKSLTCKMDKNVSMFWKSGLPEWPYLCVL